MGGGRGGGLERGGRGGRESGRVWIYLAEDVDEEVLQMLERYFVGTGEVRLVKPGCND